MDDLKPCPLCGDTELEGGKPFPIADYFCIQCGNPDCALEIEAPTAEQVSERWNMRAQPTGARAVSDEMVTAYLDAQRASCLEQENAGGTICGAIDSKAACRAGLEAALAQGNG